MSESRNMSRKICENMSNTTTEEYLLGNPTLCFTPSFQRMSLKSQIGLTGNFGVDNRRLSAEFAYVGDYFRDQLPRGLPWTKFPIVTDPQLVMKEPSHLRDPNQFVGTTPLHKMRHLLDRQELFIYDEVEFLPLPVAIDGHRARYLAAHLHRQICPDKPFFRRYVGCKDFEQTDGQDMIDDTAGRERFRYNYKLNFTAIGLKALDHVLDKHSLPNLTTATLPDQVKTWMQINRNAYLSKRNSSLSDPTALQILFAIERLDSADQSRMFEAIEKLDIRGADKRSWTFGGNVREGRWIGTGKREASVDISTALQRTFFDALALGLVEDYANQRVRLTPAGEGFLRVMHKDNDDPDAFIRFVNPETGSMPASAITRIDDWTARFFRKMKTRVNSL